MAILISIVFIFLASAQAKNIQQFNQNQNSLPIELQNQIDSLILESMERQHVPGAAVALITNNGAVSYTKGYGMRDIENNLRSDAETLFAIGSASKSFTALVVIKTLSQLFPELGSTVLDIPIRDLVPSYNLTFNDRYRSEKVNFRDLLAHRVCPIGEISGLMSQAYEGKDDFFYRYRYAPEQFGFRTSLCYNNVLIAMAGDIVAHLANSTYEELLTQLLQEIGMNGTRWIKSTDDHNNMMWRAVPYMWKDGQLTRFNPEFLKAVAHIFGGGGILSSAWDMAKYMSLYLNKGKVGERQIIPEAVMGWMTTVSNVAMQPTILKTPENPDETIDASFGYGLCMFSGTYDGWARMGHNGYIPPFDTSLNMYPGAGIGIFITANGPGGLSEMGNLTADIFHLLNGSTKKSLSPNHYNLDYDLYKPKQSSIKSNSQVAKKSEIQMSLAEAIGTYGSGFNGEMSISLRNNSLGLPQLYWSYGKMSEAWLVQVGPSTFGLSKWTSDVWQMFWVSGLGFGSVAINFLDQDTIQYLEFGLQLSTKFVRGLKLGNLPAVPWDPESCS